MNWDVIITIGVAGLGATWALRSKLSDIELLLRGHDEKHHDHERRIVRLEDYKKRF